MRTVGRHLIVEYYGCNVDRIDDVNVVRRLMISASELIGATVVGDTFHRFSPQGVSGSVVIAESHLSIHTWPEQAYVAVDIFTCGGLDPRPGFEHLARGLEAESYRLQEILRGVPADLAGHEHLLPDDVQIMTRVARAQRIEQTTS